MSSLSLSRSIRRLVHPFSLFCCPTITITITLFPSLVSPFRAFRSSCSISTDLHPALSTLSNPLLASCSEAGRALENLPSPRSSNRQSTRPRSRARVAPDSPYSFFLPFSSLLLPSFRGVSVNFVAPRERNKGTLVKTNLLTEIQIDQLPSRA